MGKLKAIVYSQQKEKKVKTVSGNSNLNGYFWKQFNEYCKGKGYTKIIENNQYVGNVAWMHPETKDILEFIWDSNKDPYKTS